MIMKKKTTNHLMTFSQEKLISQKEIKNQIKDELELFSSNFAYERLCSLNIEHYITTNYDKVLYNLLCDNGYKKGESNNTESLYSIRRKFGLQNKEGKYKYIWR